MKASKMATAKRATLLLSYRNNMSNAVLAFTEIEHILNEWEF